MLSFPLNSKIEKKLRDLHGLFAETYKKIEQLNPEELQYIHRFARISTIGASTRIENAVLTDREIEWIDTTLSKDDKPTAFDQIKHVILNKLSKDKERSIEEVTGCRNVLATVYMQHNNLFPLTEASLRGLHHELLRYHPKSAKHAGGYKTTSNRVISLNHETGEEHVVLDPSPPGIMTDTAMSDLIKWYNDTIREHPWALLVASEFVFRFLAVHPFTDGNGRLGRALFLLALLQSEDKYISGITPYISIDRHIEQNRSLYYNVLHQCSHGKFQTESFLYNYEPLVWFFIKIIESSITDIDMYRKQYSNIQQLSESATSVLKCFKSSPEKRLKMAHIVEDTGLPRRTVQYSVNNLVKKKIIQRLGQGAGSRYQLIF